MKKAGLFLLILVLSCNFAWSQDTLYIYKAGIVVIKKPITEIDSIIFNKKYTLPIQETITDLDGNVYHTVKIGTQTWMVENLKTTKYRNGDLIPNVTSNTAWPTLTSGAWCNYNNLETYSTKYGRLYNWFAVADSRKIAPIGWHVPSDAEWTKLENYLITNGYNYDGSTYGDRESNNLIAKSLAATTDWTTSYNSGAIGNDLSKNNKTGFTALGGGYRDYLTGTFDYINNYTYWWSSTESLTSYAWIRNLLYCYNYVYRFGAFKQNGLSVRLIKDVPSLPILNTATVSAITDSTAICGGKITNDGYSTITVHGICWSTTQNPTTVNNKTIDSTDTTTFTNIISGLVENTTYYVRAYATNSMGTSYGEQVSFKTYPKGAKIVTDIDGNSYLTVSIGTQTWMTENLKTTKYRNGDLIGTTSSLNMNLTYETSPKYQWAYNGLESNVPNYGRLYTWYVVSDSRNIAPVGWHVASDAEWVTLQNYLISNGYNYDKTTTGNKTTKSISSTSLWTTTSTVGSPGCDLTQNNSSGLSITPAGYRGFDGYYYNLGNGTNIWTSTEYSASTAYLRNLGYDIITLNPLDRNKNYGFSVRCVKDAQAPTLTTSSISAITDTVAVSGGNITSDGGSTVTARGTCWSTKNNPTITDSKTTSGIGTGAFSTTLTGLKADSTYYVRAYATNSAGTSYGNQLSFKAQLILTDIDGNIYHSVKIGTQTWMVENLKTTKYNDGTSLPFVADGYSWTITSNPAYSWVNNDSINKTVYGGIYNFYAASSGKLAPKGWHIPTQTDINALATFLGGYAIAGSKLKEAGNTHWISSNSDTTNSSGFTALPAGYRSSATGDFQKLGEWCVLWSSTESDGKGGRLIIGNTSAVTDYSFDNKILGFSVRCIKD